MIEIRRATRADVPALLAIYNEAVLNTTATADYEPRSLESRYEWFDEHAREGYPILVARDAQCGVVGWSSLSRYKERIGYRFTAESSIYIHRDWRGRGIGKQLMLPLIEAARAMGLHAIVAGVSGDNEASLKLHAGLGFEKVAHYRETIWKFGKWLDVVYFEMIL